MKIWAMNKRRHWCAQIWICVLLLWACSAEGFAQVATVHGHVAVVGTGTASQAVLPGTVIWLTPVPGAVSDPPLGAPNAPGNLRLVQKNKSFEPHILVIPAGSSVEFPNRDPFFHNVFSLFEGKRFDLGLYEAGTTRNVSFDRPGISYIFCNIHAEMSAVVVVLDTPYFGISNRKGELVIPNVPPGRYTMRIWHETALLDALNAMTREIRITENSSTLGILQVRTGPSGGEHKNKYGMDYEPPAPNSPAYERR